MRVVAGSARGRPLRSPPGDGARPTTDRVREALFNALHSLGAVEGAAVLDGFAGSGALGVEALSRGAASATFVERDARTRAVVEANVAVVGAAAATVVGGDLHRLLALPDPRLAGPWDLVLLDPPYAFDGWADLLRALAPTLAPAAVVVCESPSPPPVPDGWGIARQKAYGGTVVTIVTPPTSPAGRPTSAPPPRPHRPGHQR